MKTRYGTSPWIASFPAARRPAFDRFRGELTTEVAIIGGGLTGCALALALAQAGKRPVLFEADRIGQAGAGRSAGLLLPEPEPSFRELQKLHGLRAARTIFETWKQAAAEAASLLRRASIKSGLMPADTLLAAVLSGERELEAERAAREAAGLDTIRLTSKQTRQAAGVDVAALKTRAGAVLDPYRACAGLAVQAVKRKAQLFERSRVRAVRAASAHVEIALEGGGAVRAATVVVTTGAATAEFKPLQRHFKMRDRYLVLTEPLGAPLRKQLFAETVTLVGPGTPARRMRWTEDHRLLMSGADQDRVPAARRDATVVQRTGQLMYELLTMYHAVSGLRPEFGWDVTYGQTADCLPYIGPHRNYPRHLFALGGDDSLTGAFLSARLLARRLLGDAQKSDDVFGWTR
jgi:glycine/D-amino acid oxidase-like deaminating enzyme